MEAISRLQPITKTLMMGYFVKRFVSNADINNSKFKGPYPSSFFPGHYLGRGGWRPAPDERAITAPARGEDH